MKLIINYTKKTLRLDKKELLNLRQTYPKYNTLDFSYTTAGSFYLIMSVGSEDLTPYLSEKSFVFESIQFIEALQKQIQNNNVKTFTVEVNPAFSTEKVLYFAIEPLKIVQTQAITRVSRTLAWAFQTLEEYNKNNFEGRIKTNEIKIAEQLTQTI
jgi:hypothetical protein